LECFCFQLHNKNKNVRAFFQQIRRCHSFAFFIKSHVNACAAYNFLAKLLFEKKKKTNVQLVNAYQGTLQV
jgi:hypothetical protein